MQPTSDESFFLAPMGAATATSQVVWKATTPEIVKTTYRYTPPISIGLLGAAAGVVMKMGSGDLGSSLRGGAMLGLGAFGAAFAARFVLRMMFAQRENIPMDPSGWGTRSTLLDDLFPTSAA